jgi:soluble lytic murein transglycosylase
VWIYLLRHDSVREDLDESEQLFFRAKQHQAEGSVSAAFSTMVDLADMVLSGQGESGGELLLSPYGLLEFYRATAGSGETWVGTDRLVRLAKDAPPEVARRAYEYAGRLQRRAGAHRPAIELFDLALRYPMDAPDARRVHWYRLTSLIRSDPTSTVAQLQGLLAELDSPPYFADALDELAGALCERQRYDLVLSAYQQISGFATPGTNARYELIIAEALRTGRLGRDTGSVTASDYLERAAAQREALFESLVASYLLGRTGEEVLDIAEDPSVERRDRSDPTAEALARTLIRYGLADRLVSHVRSSPGQVTDSAISAGADLLARLGRTRDAMNMVARIDRPMTRDEALLAYPDPYGSTLDDLSRAERIDRWVLTALVREESYFNPDVRSSAGAVGLMQLLPTTADDIASRMRLQSFDLTDPEDNLAIGSRYVRLLLDQFGHPSLAIAAYNAGLGRVRQWRSRWGDLGAVLFHQSIPFAETYRHVAKVIVSAAYYGYLYDDQSPVEAVAEVLGRPM